MRYLIALSIALLAFAGVAAWVVQAEPDWYLRSKYPLEYEQVINAYAHERNLDPTLVAAVIYAESRFDPNVRSSAGAVGLMQVLPETGEFIARSTGGTDFVEADLRDPDLNVRYGTWLMRSLLDRYDGDVKTALAAYHAGPANVDEWRRNGDGIAFPETRAYVDEVQRVAEVYRRAYGLEPDRELASSG
jgi:soluble lytic murein transglycosylase